MLPDRSRLRAAARRHLDEQGAVVTHLGRGVLVGAVAGVLAGLSSWVFLELLDRATTARLDHGALVWFLPAAGVLIGLVYRHLGGTAGRGNDLLFEAIHEPTGWIPRRLPVLVMLGTVFGQLFGASVGREGVAVQMAGGLADWFARVVGLGAYWRRTLLVAAIAGGFGAVFGTPAAGMVFALEVPTLGRVRHEAIVPALVAALVGDRIVRGLGYVHGDPARVDVSVDPGLLVKVAAAGVAFGIAGTLFARAVHLVKRLSADAVPYLPLRLALGGVAILVLVALVGRDYLGLSVPLAGRALGGEEFAISTPVLKLVFTAICLGVGFPGGEVTPLFVIGSTLGAALAGVLGVPVPVLAAVGFVAVFAGASNTPIASMVLGAELFGSALLPALLVGCVVAYAVSGAHGIYAGQQHRPVKGHHAARRPLFGDAAGAARRDEAEDG